MPNKNKSIKNLLNPLKLSLYKTYFIVIHKFTLSGAQLSDIFMTNKLERPVHQQQHLGVFLGHQTLLCRFLPKTSIY